VIGFSGDAYIVVGVGWKGGGGGRGADKNKFERKKTLSSAQELNNEWRTDKAHNKHNNSKKTPSRRIYITETTYIIYAMCRGHPSTWCMKKQQTN
jgi:hypothetical protein